MRKVFAILAVVALMGATTSCKKDYTCTCVTTVSGSNDITTVYPLGKQKKGDAEDACNVFDGVSGTSCTL
jgi:hypothetical protein